MRVTILFIIAAVAEVAGAYLIWLWIRGPRPIIYGIAGLAALVLYGVVQTLQELAFGRTFAAYGAGFILVAALWGWWIDGTTPDRWDWLGIAVCLIGAAIMLFAPRS